MWPMHGALVQKQFFCKKMPALEYTGICVYTKPLIFQKKEIKKEEEEKKKDFILNQRVKAINRIKDFKIVRKNPLKIKFLRCSFASNCIVVIFVQVTIHVGLSPNGHVVPSFIVNLEVS